MYLFQINDERESKLPLLRKINENVGILSEVNAIAADNKKPNDAICVFQCHWIS